jgi:zinc/manganese transport system permease protein
MSLGFTFLGAAIFSMIKGQDAHIPQEAIIGITYAVASAAVIVAMSKSSGESEHLKDMLVGNILSVIAEESSRRPDLSRARRLPLRLPETVPADFDESARRPRRAFRFAVGLPVLRVVRFVVTRSVAIAGVLLVFCYLIVPSVRRMLYARRIGPAGHWLGHGRGRVDARHVFFGAISTCQPGHHRLHLRTGPGSDGPGQAAGDSPGFGPQP